MALRCSAKVFVITGRWDGFLEYDQDLVGQAQ
jgi:hypothetical protein